VASPIATSGSAGTAKDSAPLPDPAATGPVGVRSAADRPARREDGLDLPQALGEPVQLGGAPLPVLLGVGQQPAAALDRGQQASGQGGLVAVQPRAEPPGRLAELLGGGAAQPPQHHGGLLRSSLPGLGVGAGAGRPRAQQPPARRGQLLGQQGQVG
jgi:hypothetical protein